jgi:hypothetical protein
MMTQRTGLVLRLWWIAPLVCLLYIAVLIIYSDDMLVLATLGEKYAPLELAESVYSDEGYDGQSVYYIARYGWEAAPYTDVPAYRFQRILLPFLGGVLALGQSEWIIWTLLAVNLVALAGGTWLLETLLHEYRVSPWYAAGYALSAGVFGAVRLTTTEPLAYGLVIAGILLAKREKWFFSAVIFALAALAKEMTLIFPAAYSLHLCFFAAPASHWVQRFRNGVGFGVMAILPFLVWQGVLYQQFGSFGVGSGGAFATPFELLPFMGFIRILTEGGIGVFALLAPLIVLFALLPTLWGMGRCWQDARLFWSQRSLHPEQRQRSWTIETSLLWVNVLLMFFVPFSTYRELLGILRFIVGLQIAMIIYAAARRQRRILMYSTFWFMTSLVVILSDIAIL